MRIGIGKKSFNVRIYVGTAKRYVLWLIAALCVLCIAAGFVCLALELQLKRYVAEVGQQLTAAQIAGEDGASFGEDFDPDCLNHTGVYYFTVHTEDGAMTVRLRVKDTKAPEVVLREVYFAVGSKPPTPMDFVTEYYEPCGFVGEYVNDMPDLTRVGTHVMQVRYSDASGNKTPVYEVTMIQIYDAVPPTVTVPPVITVEKGKPIDYAQYIELSDNCIGQLTFFVDDSAVDIQTEGEYEVLVTATDAVGNKAKLTVTVEVISKSLE